MTLLLCLFSTVTLENVWLVVVPDVFPWPEVSALKMAMQQIETPYSLCDN